MKTALTATLALLVILTSISTGASAAIDGSINFGSDAVRPVFMKASDLGDGASVTGIELHDNGHSTGPVRVSLMESSANGDPEADSEVVLSREDRLAGGWATFALPSPRRFSGTVWIRIEFASGFSVDGAGRSTGASIGYSRVETPGNLPQLVSSDGGESFDRLDPHLQIAANVLTGPSGVGGTAGALRVDPTGSAGKQPEPALSAHPNPFNPRTAISFRLDTPGHVRLRVFDVRGRLVADLIDQDMPAGRQEFVWDAQGNGSKSLPSGVYFLTLDLPGERIVERVALVR